MIKNHDDEDSDIEYIEIQHGEGRVIAQVCYWNNDGKRHTEFFDITEELEAQDNGD